MNIQTLTDFFNANRPALTRYAFRLVHDQNKAEDIVGDAYVKAARNIENYNAKECVDAVRRWVYTIVRRLAIDVIKRDSRRQTVSIVENPESFESEIPGEYSANYLTAPDEYPNIEARDVAERILSRLNPDERTVVELIAEGATTTAAGEAVGKTGYAVRSFLQRMRSGEDSRFADLPRLARFA